MVHYNFTMVFDINQKKSQIFLHIRVDGPFDRYIGHDYFTPSPSLSLPLYSCLVLLSSRTVEDLWITAKNLLLLIANTVLRRVHYFNSTFVFRILCVWTRVYNLLVWSNRTFLLVHSLLTCWIYFFLMKLCSISAA